MEWVCGPFTPELMPDWISKVGPAIAALIAVAVYGLNRWNARSDLMAKRKVLRRMLVGHIDDVRALAMATRYLWRGEKLDPGSWVSVAAGGVLAISSIKHLLDLQTELIKVADHGDELVVEFIESCREYENAVAQISGVDESRLMTNKLLIELVERTATKIGQDLEKVISTATQARQQLDRVVRTGTVGTVTRFIRRGRVANR